MRHFRQRLKNAACYRGEIVRDVDLLFLLIRACRAIDR
jgi:hypothetical protein